MATILCVSCHGTGQIGGVSCALCGGDGERDAFAVWGMTEAHKISMFQIIANHVLATNVFHSYEVEPCLDGTEYNALTDTQKEGVKIILSCGRVDLSDGASMKTRLWNWFGAESTTVANLTALIG